jgi:hypothetical protein
MTTLTLDERIQRNPDAGLAALDWSAAHADEIATECRAAGVSPLEFGGPVIDAAMVAACRGDLDALTPHRAVQRARAAMHDAEVIVTSGRGHRGRWRAACACVALDDASEGALASGSDPLAALLAGEAEREREDWADDHDDRLSPEAKRCARGLPPVPEPSCSERTLRRHRAKARHIAARQRGFPGLGFEEA